MPRNAVHWLIYRHRYCRTHSSQIHTELSQHLRGHSSPSSHHTQQAKCPAVITFFHHEKPPVMAAFERANPSYSLLFFTEYTSSCVISSAHNHNRRQSTLPDTNCIRAPSSQNSGYAFGYNTFAELFRWRSMRTAFGAIGKETFDRTSLFADTRLCARLSLRDTPARFILQPIARPYPCSSSSKSCTRISGWWYWNSFFVSLRSSSRA